MKSKFIRKIKEDMSILITYGIGGIFFGIYNIWNTQVNYGGYFEEYGGILFGILKFISVVIIWPINILYSYFLEFGTMPLWMAILISIVMVASYYYLRLRK